MKVLKKCFLPILVIVLFFTAFHSFGFSMGYHCDLIKEVLTHLGYDERTIELVMAANEFTDLYSTSETFYAIDLAEMTDIKQNVMDFVDFFHATRKLNFEQIKKFHEMLIQNMAAFIDSKVQILASGPYIQPDFSARPPQVCPQYKAYADILIAMGIAIHCIEDVYAHSNFAELDMPHFTRIPDATFFDVMYTHDAERNNAVSEFLTQGIQKSEYEMYTNYTDQNAKVPQHEDIYKDFASRAYFDTAYRTAFRATMQWARWVEHRVGEAFADSLRNFQWNPLDKDLDTFTSYDNDSGTARYLCLYGGAWKHWDRWSKPQVVMHDLPNVAGIGLTNSLLLSNPFLYQQWQPICLALGHGLFKVNLDETTCEVIDSNNTLFPNDWDTLNHPTDPVVHRDLPLDRLPTTDIILVEGAVSYMTDETVMADYYGMKWIKMEIPYIEDNDTGDSWWNWGDINDEDPGSSSDYYVEWFVGPASKKLQYAESIYIENSSPVMNCQVLKPCWGPEPVDVQVIVRDSDKVDVFKQLVHYGTSGVGYIWTGATNFVKGGINMIGGLTGFPGVDIVGYGLGAILDSVTAVLDAILGLGDSTEDDEMDINPESPKSFSFQINPDTLELYNLPGKITKTETSYGYLIKSSGHDGSTFSDNSAKFQLRVSQAKPVTKVRISVLDMHAQAFILPIMDTVAFETGATVNNLKLPNRTWKCANPSGSITPGNGGLSDVHFNPYQEVTFEGYVDYTALPITLRFNSGIPLLGNRAFDLFYHFSDQSIRDKKNNILGYSGYEFIFSWKSGDQTIDVTCRITINDGTHSDPLPPEQILEYACLDPNDAADAHIKPAIRIENIGNQEIPLEELTVRYWYTSEGYQPQSFWVDSSSLPADSITGQFVHTKYRTGADGYCQIEFTSNAGVLPAYGSTGEIRLRFDKTDWAPYNETGDYSYDPSMIELTPNPTITLYRNSILIYGKEPELIPEDEMPQPSVEVYAKDEGLHEGNIVKPRIYVRNTGLVTIPRFEMRYHFTVENGKTPVVENYYAPQSIVTLVDEGNGEYYVSYIVDCPQFGAGTVYPGMDGNVVGIHYADWSALDKANDYSNPGSDTFVRTDKIEIIFLPPLAPPGDTQPPQTAIPFVRASIKDEGFSEGNIVKPRIYIENTGTAAITGDIEIKYYFTVENNKTPVVEGWYLPQATISLEHVNQNDYCARLRIGNATFAPGGVLPGYDGYVFGIHYSDWSAFDKSNDRSNPGSATWVDTDKIDVVR